MTSISPHVGTILRHPFCDQTFAVERIVCGTFFLRPLLPDGRPDYTQPAVGYLRHAIRLFVPVS